MSLETSKKVLKIFGIIGIIFAIFGLIGGLAVVAGGGLITAGLADPSLNADGSTDTTQAAGVAGLVIVLGVVLIISALIALLEGIFSVRAAKDSSKIMPAFVFAILGVLSGVGSLATTVTTGSSGTQIASGVISLAISCLVLVAANTIRTSRNKL